MLYNNSNKNPAPGYSLVWNFVKSEASTVIEMEVEEQVQLLFSLWG